MEEEIKEKKKNKVNRKKIVMYIVLALIIMYLTYAVYLLVKQPTDKVTVENGTLYLEETDIGYIIRDEQVVKGNNYKNGMERIKNEGEKTAKGDSIYRYYSKNEDKLKEQIKEIRDDWNERHKKLAIYIEHDELEKIETNLASLNGYLDMEEYGDSMAQLEASVYVLEHIKNKTTLSMINIF